MNKKTIEINSKSIIVKELTVGELRDWLSNIATAKTEINTLDSQVFAFFGLTASDLKLFCENLNDDDICQATQTEIEKLIEVAKSLNKNFFQFRDKKNI